MLSVIQAVSVLSFQALAHIIALCTAMPLLHSSLIFYLRDSEQANFVVMKVCVVFHLIGTALMGFSKKHLMMFIGMSLPPFATHSINIHVYQQSPYL